MYVWIVATVLLGVLYVVATLHDKRVEARVQRIRRVRGPHARICYMNMRGKRYTWQISIESVRPRGHDWQITAWCHEKNEFLVFYASRMYEYFDLQKDEEIKNVPAHFTERFGGNYSRKSA